MFDWYVSNALKYRWLIIFATLGLIFFVALGLKYLKFTADYKIFFKSDNPDLIALESVQNTYTKSENVFLTIEPQDGDVFTKKNLDAIEKLTRRAWQIPYAIRVDSITNFQHTYGKDDELIVEDLVTDAILMTDEQVGTIRRVALNQPLLRNWLISLDGKVSAINITVELPGLDEQKETPEVAKFVRQLVADFEEENPDFNFYLTGGVMMNNAFPEASQHDIEVLTPLMYLVVFVGLVIFFKSVSVTVVCICVIVLSILGALGAAGWLGIRLSPPSAIAPNIILTLAVADCVHFVVIYLQELQGGWMNNRTWKQQKATAIKESLRVNLQPIFLTSLTTGLGFLSLNFGESPPFHDLGNIVAIGVLIAFCLSISFLPALIYVMPLGVRVSTSGDIRFLSLFGRFIIDNRTRFLLGSILFTVALTAFLPLNKLDDEPLKYFDKQNKFRSDTEFTTSRLTGLFVIDYAIPSGKEGGVSDPQYLNYVEEFVRWLRTQTEVRHVYSISEIFKELNKNLHGNDVTYYRMPDTQQLAAQYFLLYELSLPMGMDLNDRVNLDKSATRVSIRVTSLSSAEMLAFEERVQTWMQLNLPRAMVVPGTSGSMIFANIGITNIKSMLEGSVLAFFLISFVIMVALRSIGLGFLSLIPNLVPSFMAFGLWGLIDGNINLGIAAVTGLTLGIVVDDTVHFLSKFNHAYRDKKLDAIQSVRYAFIKVGTALWITSTVLIAGFLVLTLSDFAVNAKMGLLTAIVIGCALVADFLLLPGLLVLRARRASI